MEELVRIRRSTSTGEPVVSARDLHKYLGVKKDFSTWIKDRIDKYGFVENLDFSLILYNKKGERIQLPKKGEFDRQWGLKVYRIEYALTMDCAKELAMVQNNERGRQVRRYFIVIEKEYRRLEREGLIQLQKSELYSMGEAAKILNLRDYYGIVGRNILYNILRHRKIMDDKNRPVLKYVEKGYFTNYPTRVTEKGLGWLNQMLTLEGVEVKKLKKEIKSVKQENEVIQEGVTTIMEMFLVNKMGRSAGEEKNRCIIEKMRKYIDKTKPQQKMLGK